MLLLLRPAAPRSAWAVEPGRSGGFSPGFAELFAHWYRSMGPPRSAAALRSALAREGQGQGGRGRGAAGGWELGELDKHPPGPGTCRTDVHDSAPLFLAAAWLLGWATPPPPAAA
jgi:hypothetical protein